jgi:hypothetical protein
MNTLFPEKKKKGGREGRKQGRRKENEFEEGLQESKKN